MRKLVFLSAISALLATGPSLAQDGQTIFQSKGCTVCHDAQQDRVAMGLGPSLKQISEAYKGQEDALTAFLKGQGEPKVYPDKYPIMKGQLAITQALPDDELKALATYLTSH